MTATVTKLQTISSRALKRARVAKPKLARYEGASVLGVSATVLALSLKHVSDGVSMITGASVGEATAMAIGIEGSYVALEAAMLLAPEHLRARVARFAFTAIYCTLAGSALLNAMSFASHAEGWRFYPAIVLGCAIPGLVYSLTRVGAVLCTGRGK